jgi:DNA-binding response OmpR family regulator
MRMYARACILRLKANNYDTFFAADALSAISEARKHEPDLIILDLARPGSTRR